MSFRNFEDIARVRGGASLELMRVGHASLARVRVGYVCVACAAILFVPQVRGRQKFALSNVARLPTLLAQTNPQSPSKPAAQAQQKPTLPNASGLPKPLAQAPPNPAKPATQGQTPEGQAAQPRRSAGNPLAQPHPAQANSTSAHHPPIHLAPVHAATAWRSADRIVQGAVALLPKIILAVAVFIVFVIAARLFRWGIRRLGEKRGIRRNAATLLAKLVQLGILIVGLMAALSIVAPSFTLSDLIKMLGIGGVAIGFAFKDILQNFLAGILLLINEPFQIGDQISVVGMEGAVDEIQARATLITTPDGDRVVMPNSTIFTNPVTVRKQKSGVLAQREQEERQRREQGGKK